MECENNCQFYKTNCYDCPARIAQGDEYMKKIIMDKLSQQLASVSDTKTFKTFAYAAYTAGAAADAALKTKTIKHGLKILEK